MPIIPNYEEQANTLSSSPGVANVQVNRFGADLDQLKNIGGQAVKLGVDLARARKQSMDADVVAEKQTERMSQIDKLAEDLKNDFDPSGEQSNAEIFRERSAEMMQEDLDGMPSGTAQKMYQERMDQVLGNKYKKLVSYESEERVKTKELRFDRRVNDYSQQIQSLPTIEGVFERLRALDQDLNANGGALGAIAEAKKPMLFQKGGRSIVTSYYKGLADNAVEVAANLDPNNPGMSGQDAAKMIAKGRAELSSLPPELRGLLSGDDVDALNNKFDTAERQIKTMHDYNDSQAKKIKKEESDKERIRMVENIETGKASMAEIFKNDKLDPADKEGLINRMKAKAREEQKPNAKALSDVIQRITDEESPDRITSDKQILSLYYSGALTEPQYRRAMDYWNGKFTVEGQQQNSQMKALLSAARRDLSRDTMGNPDPIGGQNIARFNDMAMKKIEEYKKAGKPLDELFDQNSSQSLYKQINGYRKTFQQTMQETMDANAARASTAATPPALTLADDEIRVVGPGGRTGKMKRSAYERANQAFALQNPGKTKYVEIK